MFGEGGPLLKYAREKGLKVIVDCYISPMTFDILQAEQSKYPDLEPMMPSLVVERGRKHFDEICEVANYFTAPSEFVKKGLQQFGVSDDRIIKVPYFVDESWMHLKTFPKKGKILFVGTAELRKGIHILGMAASSLSYYNYEFRIAGDFSKQAYNHELMQNLKFLGRIPRSEIFKEYAQADIFVFPSLSEGSASVTYEALGAGIPVIATEAAGSVVRDGMEGFIIPERDSKALAHCIKDLVENRELRDRMSAAAKQRAQDYTWEKYEQRLLSVFNSI